MPRLGLAALIAVFAAASVSAQTLRLGLTELPATRGNPYGGIYIPALWTLGATYDPLTKIYADGTLGPWLARSWQSTSPTTWRFVLREDVTFSDGTSFDAEAVVLAVNALVAPGAAAFPLARELASLKAARVIGPHTVEIETDGPNPILPKEVAYLLIPSPKAWADGGANGLAARPIGTGPYTLASWDAGRAEFAARPSSWRKPRAQRLEYIQIKESSAKLQALITDQIDAATEISVDDTMALEAAGGQVVELNLAGVTSIVLNTEKDTPLRDTRVRRALNLAVNRERIVAQLLNGRARVANQPAPRVAEGYNPAVVNFPYDPGTAKALLVEAGYPNGFKMIMESGSAAGSINTLITQQIAADLARINVDMEVRPVLLSQLLLRVQQGGWEGTAFNFSFFTPTLDALRPMRNQSCLWIKPWYCDPGAIPAITAAQTEFDPAKRRQLLQSAMARSHEQAQAIFIYEGVGFMGLGRRMASLPSDFGFIRFEDIEFKN